MEYDYYENEPIEYYDDDDNDTSDDEAWDSHYCSTCGGDGLSEFDDCAPCDDCEGTGIDPEYW